MDRLPLPHPGRSVSLVLGATVLHRQTGQTARHPRSRSRPYVAGAFMPGFAVVAAVRGTLASVLGMAQLYRRAAGRRRPDKPVQFITLTPRSGTNK